MRRLIFLLLLACGCGDSAVNACYRVCQTYSTCVTNFDINNCRSTCDRAPVQCRNDPAITDMLNACAETRCDRLNQCVIAFAVQHPECNPNQQHDGGP